MNQPSHYILTKTSPGFGQKDPYTTRKLQPGERVVNCGNGHVYLEESWEALRRRCPICESQETGASDPAAGKPVYFGEQGHVGAEARSGTGGSGFMSSPAVLITIAAVAIVAIVAVAAVLIVARPPRPPETVIVTVVATSPPQVVVIVEPTATQVPVIVASPQPQRASPSSSLGSSASSDTGVSCDVYPSGRFADLWSSFKNDIGCPVSGAPGSITDAEQLFQNGHMFWRSDTDTIYVVYDGGGATSGSLLRYGHARVAALPGVSQCPEHAPQGLVRPKLGFGAVWCSLGGQNANIGWALDSEYGFGDGQGQIWVQDFQNGTIFQDSDGVANGRAYVLFNSGRFRHVRQ